LLAGGALFVPLRSGVADANAPPTRQRELQQQRLEILKTLLQGQQELEKRGVPDATREIRQSILNAELDLCESAKDQVAFLEKRVEFAKDDESRVTKLHQQGVVSSSEIDLTKCKRLAAEIDVERAKNGERVPVARSASGQME
jgi:hypothetical protein